MRKMKDEETKLLDELRLFVQVYASVRENLNDPKMEEINNAVILPIIKLGNDLLNLFGEIDSIINQLEN